MNSNILIGIGVIIILSICGKFGVDFYNKTRPDFKNVVYSEVSDSNTLDIYLPKYECTDTGSCKEPQPYPVVIWIHGGGFKGGSKSNPRSLDRLLSEGFAVVSVNYRLSDEAKWPAQLKDMEGIVRFIKLNAGKYKLNKDKIASWGESAGGYLSSMMVIALAGNPETRIQSGINWFGPVDFSTMDSDMEKTKIERETGRNEDEGSAESNLIGGAVKDNKELASKASLLTYIKEGTTPPPTLLIMHGKEDPMIGYPQSQKLNIALQSKFGISAAELILLDYGTHGGGDFNKKETEDKVVEFLKKNLK